MEESTQEGDDETVIVYGEQSVENPWEFSQASRNSQDSTYENSQHQPIRSFDYQEEAPSSNWIPRKRRHRSLSRSPNFRQRNDLPTVDQGIRDEDLGDEGVDHFASLRHLLSERSHSQERLLDGGRENHADIPKEKDEDETSTENIPIQKPFHETENRQLCSPPDFDLCTSDNEDDDGDDFKNETSCRMKNHHKKISSSGKTKFSATPSNKSSRGRSDEPKRFSAVSSAAISSSTKSRKRNRPETISRRVFSSSLNSQKERQPDSSLPTQSATNVKNVKSIVGLRYVTS